MPLPERPDDLAERYRTLLEVIDEGYDVVELLRDAAGHVTDVRIAEANHALEQLLGLPRGGATGRRVRELLPDLEPAWFETLEDVARSGAGRRFQGDLASIGRRLDVHAVPLGPARSDRLVMIVRDITEQERTETRLRDSEVRLRALLVERDRHLAQERKAREAAEAFLGVMSHELKTPVTSIYGTANLLTRNLDRLEELAADIVEESFRLTRIVDDLLVLSGVERGLLRLAPEPVLVSHAIASIAAEVRRRFPGVEIHVDAPAGLPAALADGTAFRQIAGNLLTNAAKYAGPAGPIEVTAASAGDHIMVRVTDHGPGPGPDPEALFGLFYRSPHTERIASGTGIGLYVARELAVAMGGSLAASERPGGGAEFRLELPTDQPDAGLSVDEPDPYASGPA
ncbi:MAG: ATP-binding protein [Chloroflexota bacterium]